MTSAVVFWPDGHAQSPRPCRPLLTLLRAGGSAESFGLGTVVEARHHPPLYALSGGDTDRA